MRGFGLCRGGGEGKHISLAAIFEGETHITSDMCSGTHISRETHITVTPARVKFGTAKSFTPQNFTRAMLHFLVPVPFLSVPCPKFSVV